MPKFASGSRPAVTITVSCFFFVIRSAVLDIWVAFCAFKGKTGGEAKGGRRAVPGVCSKGCGGEAHRIANRQGSAPERRRMKNPLVALIVGILIGVGGLYFFLPYDPLTLGGGSAQVSSAGAGDG